MMAGRGGKVEKLSTLVVFFLNANKRSKKPSTTIWISWKKLQNALSSWCCIRMLRHQHHHLNDPQHNVVLLFGFQDARCRQPQILCKPLKSGLYISWQRYWNAKEPEVWMVPSQMVSLVFRNQIWCCKSVKVDKSDRCCIIHTKK